MRVGARPTDEQILAAANRYGGWNPTYVIANILASKEGGGFDDLRTSHLLYRLRKLERAGKVKNQKTHNNMNLWGVV